MKIVIDKQFNSISPFEWINIPKLSIITGLNGVGKSQLLKFIAKNPKVVHNESGIEYTIKDITVWDSSGGEFPAPHNFQMHDLVLIASKIKEFKNPTKVMMRVNSTDQNDFKHTLERIDNQLSNFGFNIKGLEQKIIDSIESNSGKSVIDMDLKSIMYHFPEQLFLKPDNISADRLEMLFYMYHFRKTMDTQAGKITDEYPNPPWDLLNEVFAISNLPFEINSPEFIDVNFDIGNINNYSRPKDEYKYKINIIHKEANTNIDFNDISSGERTIMSLAFLHYYAQQQGSLNKLLLLDEPDAHLHPSLTNQFLEVVDKFLIKKYGAKVIMTTHSPSTVGLCKEDAIFIMSKNPTTINKQSRSDAINYLTDGIPILSSIIDNRRYIFVEDEDDASFYTLITTLVRKELNSEISLIFVPASYKKNKKSGGKNAVMSIVEKLRVEAKMSLVKGLIDRDSDGWQEKDGVVLLKRYSMENYFFDPILIAAFQINFGIIENIGGIAFPNLNCNKIEDLNNEELQLVVDDVIEKIESNFNSTVTSLNAIRKLENRIKEDTLSIDEKVKVSVSLSNGYQINYPLWMMKRRGHDLEDIFRTLFSSDSNFVNQENMMNILRRLPCIIPTDIIETLKKLY